MKLKNIILSLATSVTVLFSACQPDEISLSGKDVLASDLVEGIAYTITPDSENPNIIYLESKMGSEYTPLWNHPQGRSQAQKITLKIPFSGTYDVVFGVQTRGGYVYGDTAHFTIANVYTGFISDELWTFLTGGVGESKTWITDNGKYGLATGPLSYADPTSVVEYNNYTPNWEPKQSDLGLTDEQLGIGSTMTFALKNGAIMTTNKVNEGGIQEVGSYYLNTTDHTLTTTDATILRPDNYIANAANWNKDLKILTLNKNQLRIAVMRTNSEGSWWYIWNYVSKTYADNYVPEDTPDPEPELPNNWEDAVSQTVSKTIIWKLSETTPLNWCNLDGSLMNPWNSASDYPDWLGKPDPSTYNNFSLTINADEKTAVFEAPDGTKVSTTYNLDAKGIYTFADAAPEFSIINWAGFKTDGNKQLRIMKIETDITGNVSGMWVGAKDAAKPEYMAYHLIPSAGSSSVDPLTTVKKILSAKTWKLDSSRSYDQTTTWGAEQGPVIFSDYATWAWNPKPGEHYAAGEADIDYGTFSFKTDGTVTVNQRQRIYTYDLEGTTTTRTGLPKEGDVLVSDEVVTKTGTYTIDLDANTMTMSIGILHPWTSDYMAADWGAIKIYRIESNAVLLQVTRSKELSGEDAMPITYIFVPAQ